MTGVVVGVTALIPVVGAYIGAVVGGFLIGICENIIRALGYSTFSDAFTFALLILVLCIKPTGLFGEKLEEKV